MLDLVAKAIVPVGIVVAIVLANERKLRKVGRQYFRSLYLLFESS